MEKNIFSGSIAAIGALLISFLGGWDMGIKILIGFVVLDYATGLISAFINKKLDSNVGRKGIAKKVCIFALVAVAHAVDNYTGQHILRDITVLFYISNEFISILENVKKIGLPIPAQLARALDSLKDKESEKKSDK